MFTYIEEDKTLLTCDAFGCHFASVDAEVVNSEDYLKSAKHYYDCIVKPFAKHVLSAVDKVVGLNIEFDTILTSHGPMLTKDPMAAVKDMLSGLQKLLIQLIKIKFLYSTYQLIVIL